MRQRRRQRCSACRARWRSPTRSWPTRASRRSSAASGSRRSRRKGASPQRPLWASTGTKNKAYSDILYVDSLIGPDTVNTLPPATLDAFRDHGTVARTIDQGVDEARATMATLKEAGIDIDAVTQQLEDEGVASFAKSFDDLLAGVEAKRQDLKTTA